MATFLSINLRALTFIQTKLDLPMQADHVRAPCGNKSCVRDGYLSAPVHFPSLPLLPTSGSLSVRVRLAASPNPDWTADWAAHRDNYRKRLFFCVCVWVCVGGLWLSLTHLWCKLGITWSSPLLVIHLLSHSFNNLGLRIKVKGKVYNQTIFLEI